MHRREILAFLKEQLNLFFYFPFPFFTGFILNIFLFVLFL